MTAHRLAAWNAAVFLSASLFAHTVALRLLCLLAAAGLLAYVLARDRDTLRGLPPIWIPFALWAAWAAASIAWSIEPERSVQEFRNEIGYAGLALWVCFVAGQAPKAMRIFLPVTAVAVAGVCSFAIFWYLADEPTWVRRWHSGPGDHSSALLTILPCVLMAGWYGWRNGWPHSGLAVIAALLLIVVAAAYSTLNRTVWLGFGVELLLILAFLLWVRPRTRPGKIGIKTLFLAGAVAGVAVGGSVAVHYERAAEKAPGKFALKKDPRLRLWPEVTELIMDRPLTGHGFGRGLFRRELQEEMRSGLLWHAHNVFLDSALQIGIPGLALFVLVLLAILREAWRSARDPDELASACGIALACVLAGMLVRNMTDTLFVRQNALLFWGVTGVLLAWGAARRPRAASPALAPA